MKLPQEPLPAVAFYFGKMPVSGASVSSAIYCNDQTDFSSYFGIVSPVEFFMDHIEQWRLAIF
jgi:hypothetical protein